MKFGDVDPRLMSAAAFVRQGAVLADIGTDHGYLPIFLLEAGRIERAVLADINEGPLASARDNCAKHSLSDRVSFFLTDGARGLDGEGVTDLTVCGMGGELIASIIEASPWLKNESLRLILQPMSRQEKLISYLISHGFEITERAYSVSGGKYYLCLVSVYSGRVTEMDELEMLIGDVPADPCQISAYIGYLKGKLSTLNKMRNGRAGQEREIAEAQYNALLDRIAKLSEE